MFSHRILHLVYTFLLFPAFSTAQSEVVKFDHIDLSPIKHDKILCLSQDSKGYIWLGSFDGLHRYNAFEIKTFLPKHNDTSSISSRVVNAIAESKGELLYIATDYGLNEFDPVNESFRRIALPISASDPIVPKNIKCLHIANNGTIWIGTFGEGLFSYDQNTEVFKQYSHSKGNNSTIQSDLINCIFESSNGHIYVGTESGGFSVLDPDSKTINNYLFESPSTNIGASNTVNNFYEDTKGIWIGTWRKGLKLYDPQQKELTDPIMTLETKQLLAKATVRDIAPFGKEHLWLATFYSGLILYNKTDGSSKVFKQDIRKCPSSLNSNSIYSLLNDDKGNLWIGTFGGGLHMYNHSKHTISHFKSAITTKNSISSNDIYSVAEQGHYLWFGTNGKGLNRLNTETGEVDTYLTNRAKRDRIVRILKVDDQKRLWAGTENGLYFYNRQLNKMIPINNISGNKPDKTHEPVYGITQDAEGNIWIGFHGDGLYKIPRNQLDSRTPGQWELSKVKQTDQGDSIPNGTVMLLKSAGNDIWASINNFLIRYNVKNGSFHKFPNKGFSCLHETRTKDLWFGTYTKGLAKFNQLDSSFEFVDSLKSDSRKMITGITSDSLQNLWIFTYSGMYKLNPENNKTEHFTVEDGLHSDYIQPNTSVSLSSGELLMAGKNGYNIFNPYNIEKHKYKPTIKMSDFKILNKSVTVDKGKSEDILFNRSINHLKTIELKYEQNVLTFEFAVLNYTKSQNIHITYMLEGFDNGFNTIKDQSRSITYTNLDPGTYNLLYKCSDTRGNWSESSQSLQLIIHPPFWMTWWFKSLVTFIIAILLFLAYRARILRIKNRHKLEQAEQEKKIAKLEMNSLQETLEHKNTELASATMNVVKRNNAIKHIQNRIKELTNRLPASHQGQFKLYLKQLNREKEEEMSWDEFVRNFDAVHNDFIKRFSEAYPKLTQKDLRTCAYLRMNLTNEDIASIQNITLRAVETARYRIRQKIELQSKDTLSEFVCKF